MDMARAGPADPAAHEPLERADALERWGDAWSFLSHELMGSVALLHAHAATLTERWDDLDDAGRLESTRWLEREISGLRELGQQTITIMSFETGGASVPTAERRAIDLARTACDAVEELGGRLRLHVGDGAEDAWVRCDPAGILQVIKSLLVNAAGFSPGDDPIRLDLSATSSEVEFAVTGASPGISQEQLEAPFHGITASRSARGSGRRGLALYICRRIVEAHDGSIGVTSQEGRGATFRFAIPRLEERATDGPGSVERPGG